MPALCDANVLLAFAYERHVHAAVLAWLDAQPPRTALLCRITQLSLLRLLCHTTVMGADARTLAGAWSGYDAIQNDERFRFVAEPEPLEGVLRPLCTSPARRRRFRLATRNVVRRAGDVSCCKWKAHPVNRLDLHSREQISYASADVVLDRHLSDIK